MKTNSQLLRSSLVLLLSLMISTPSIAHMIVAQHGTLNVVDDGVFMVLSLPVSAFENVDDDNDGKLSKIEFDLHRKTIVKVINENVVLKDRSGTLILQGMMLSPVTSHHSAKEPASQLMVMGRYALLDPNSALEYRIELFGSKSSEQLLEITATRKSDDKKQSIELTPTKSSVTFF